MAHPQQYEFINSVKSKFPEAFNNVRVLEVGSLNINGTIRVLFNAKEYIGIDLGVGPGVDIVSLGHEYDSDKPFDTVISCECFEHDMYWQKTIMNCVRLTKPGGLFTFTAATTGRQEHGTKRTTPQDSPFSHGQFSDYYHNIPENEVREIEGFIDSFSQYEFSFHTGTKDIYFWGIKKA